MTRTVMVRRCTRAMCGSVSVWVSLAVVAAGESDTDDPRNRTGWSQADRAVDTVVAGGAGLGLMRLGRHRCTVFHLESDTDATCILDAAVSPPKRCVLCRTAQP